MELRDDYSPYPANPTGTCRLCNAAPREDFEGTGRRERIVDTGTVVGLIDLPGEFSDEICESCVVSMGRLVGMVGAAEVDEVRALAALVSAGADQLRAERNDLRTALDALTRAGLAPVESDVVQSPRSSDKERP